MDARTILDAVKFLQACGHEVAVADGIPGLFNVDGREVTSGQLIDIAAQVATQDHDASRRLLDPAFYWQPGAAPSGEYKEHVASDGKTYHRKK